MKELSKQELKTYRELTSDIDHLSVRAVRHLERWALAHLFDVEVNQVHQRTFRFRGLVPRKHKMWMIVNGDGQKAFAPRTY